ncbi:MAG: copper chaperone [Bacteroidetes bacterium]|nr:MAG: copper chaperone [Bacteroidota bacterium]
MKHFLLPLFLVVFAFASQAQEQLETITIKTSIFCDHCMECDDCGFNIDTHIRKLKGVRKVSIKPEEKAVEVTFRADKTTPDEIRGAISKAGFDADDVKADPEAYAKLDGCCKKPD